MMKAKLLGMVAGTALMVLQPGIAAAHTNVVVGVEFGIPVPVVVEAFHYHDYAYAPVRYSAYRPYPARRAYRPHRVRCYERHDRGYRRGHYRRR